MNLLVLLAYFSLNQPQRKKIPVMLLAHQAVVDIYGGVIFSISVWLWAVILYPIYGSDNHGSTLYPTFNTYKNAAWFSCSWTSLLNFAVMTTERYLSINRPFLHRTYITRKRIKMSFLAVWLLVLTLFVCVTYLLPGYDAVWNVRNVPWLVCLISNIIHITTLIILSYKKSRESIMRNSTNDSVQDKRNNRLLKMFIVMNICLVIHSLLQIVARGYGTIIDSDNFGRYEYYVFTSCSIVSSLWMTLITALNPILSFYVRDDFRAVIRKRFNCCNKQGQNEEAIEMMPGQVNTNNI